MFDIPSTIGLTQYTYWWTDPSIDTADSFTDDGDALVTVDCYTHQYSQLVFYGPVLPVLAGPQDSAPTIS